MKKRLNEEIQAQIQINQNLLQENKANFKERVNIKKREFNCFIKKTINNLLKFFLLFSVANSPKRNRHGS